MKKSQLGCNLKGVKCKISNLEINSLSQKSEKIENLKRSTNLKFLMFYIFFLSIVFM